MREPKAYLGDGVYVADDGYQFELSTLEGHSIFLEPSVITSFFKFLESRRNLVITVRNEMERVEADNEIT